MSKIEPYEIPRKKWNQMPAEIHASVVEHCEVTISSNKVLIECPLPENLDTLRAWVRENTGTVEGLLPDQDQDPNR